MDKDGIKFLASGKTILKDEVFQFRCFTFQVNFRELKLNWDAVVFINFLVEA